MTAALFQTVVIVMTLYGMTHISVRATLHVMCAFFAQLGKWAG